jgi:hypothetical protein
MRQLVKSALSLGWALSLLGAKQAYSLVAGDPVSHEDVLSPVTQAAVDQLDESMKRVHRSAATIESRAVDIAFSFMNRLRWQNPQRWKGWTSGAKCGQAATVPNPGQAVGTESQASCAGPDSASDPSNGPVTDDCVPPFEGTSLGDQP